MNNTFLIKQHIYIKLLFVIISLFLTFIADLKTITVLIILNLIFFHPICLPFLLSIVKLSFFWIFYLLCGIFFSINFITQIHFLLCIIFMLQLSVFLQRATCFQNVINDIIPLLKYPFFQNLVLFFLYLNNIIIFLVQSYKDSDIKKIPFHKRFSFSYIDKIMTMIKTVLENVKIKCKNTTFITDKKQTKGSSASANYYLIIITLIYVILCYIFQKELL